MITPIVVRNRAILAGLIFFAFHISLQGVALADPLQDKTNHETNINAAVPAKEPIESIYTNLSADSCIKEIDKTDPNETPYLVCPGVAGYKLILRRVDAGRQSIDVVDPAQQVFPLNYHEVITRHMFTLYGKVEWRVAVRKGKQVPIALIVSVQAHEKSDDPGQVTHTYWAVARMTSSESCVTDKILAGTQSRVQIRRTADSAQARHCLEPQPPMTTAQGEIVR